MRFPSKVTPYKDSVISKFSIILSIVRDEDISPTILYKKVSSKVADVGEFVEILDCLYALGKIDLDEGRGVIIYVD